MSAAAAAARRLPPSKNRNALIAGAAGLGLVLAGIGLAIASGGDDAEKVELSSGTNVAVTGDDGNPLVAYNSPAVVASPTDANTLVVAARVDRPQLAAAVLRSDDGGRTWSRAELPLPSGEVRAHMPDVAFDAEGVLYAAFHTVSDPENNPTGLWLARSDDGGATFDPPARVGGPFGYQPRVAAGSAGNVHVAWVQASEATASVRDGFGPPPNPVMAASSTDGGETFADPVQVSAESRERVGAPVPVVAGDRVYVLYQDFADDAADLEGRTGRSVYDGEFALVLARSTDGGATYEEAGVVDDAVVPFERFNPYYPKAPSIAVDPSDGDLYVAWADATNGDADVFVRRAEAGGATWGARTQVNEDGSAPEADQYLPVVSVAPDGRVDVAYLDRSGDDDNLLAAAALSTSFDDGGSWRTVVVSDRMFDSRVGPPTPEPGTADAGSRLGLISRADEALVSWTDTRHGDEDTGRQDVYFAPVRLVPQ